MTSTPEQRNSTEQKRLRAMAVDSAARAFAAAPGQVNPQLAATVILDQAEKLFRYINTGQR